MSLQWLDVITQAWHHYYLYLDSNLARLVKLIAKGVSSLSNFWWHQHRFQNQSGFVFFFFFQKRDFWKIVFSLKKFIFDDDGSRKSIKRQQQEKPIPARHLITPYIPARHLNNQFQSRINWKMTVPSLTIPTGHLVITKITVSHSSMGTSWMPQMLIPARHLNNQFQSCITVKMTFDWITNPNQTFFFRYHSLSS